MRILKFALYIFLLLCNGLFAQTTITLNSSFTGATHDKIARDAVILKQGFTYTADSLNSFTAKTDFGLLYPPTNGTYAKPDGSYTTNPTEGAVVGNFSGQFNVSPVGGATYSVPIDCPAGINGMQPAIAAVYNSLAGDGNIGWACSLSGLSAISRVPKNYYFDGDKTGYIWDFTSPIALDGMRLLEIKRWGTGGTDSVEYNTENESYSRVVGYNIQYWGPQYFKAYLKSGQTVQYGNPSNTASYMPQLYLNANSMVKHLGWCVSRISDANGNYIDFEYENQVTPVSNGYLAGNNVIKKIKYGGNLVKNTQPNYLIEIDYVTKPTPQNAYLDGAVLVNNLCVQQIRVLSAATLLHKYSFNYEGVDNKLHLKTIHKFNGKGELLNPIELAWTNNTYSLAASTVLHNAPSPLMTSLNNQGYIIENAEKEQIFGDIDGDGDTDYFVQYQLKKNNDLVEMYALYRNDGGAFFCVFDFIKQGCSYQSPIFLDRDNDGKDELYIGDASQWDRYVFRCYKYANNSVLEDQAMAIVVLGSFYSGANESCEGITSIPGDFLGVGETQFIFFSYYKLTGAQRPVGMPSTYFDTSALPSLSGVDFQLTDMNGNGKQEITFANSDGFLSYELVKQLNGMYKFCLVYSNPDFKTNSNSRKFVGDFNGDGNTDLLIGRLKWNPEVEAFDYSWKMYYSTGAEYFEQIVTNLFAMTATSKILTLDANKDGKTDILFNNPNDNLMRLFVSTGIGFEEKANFNISAVPYTSIKTIGNFTSNIGNEIYLGNYYTPAYKALLKITDTETINKLAQVEDSYLNKTSISYKRCTINSFKSIKANVLRDRTSIDNNAFSQSTPSWFVVSDVHSTSADGKVQTSSTYSFSDAVIHKQGKGFLGFLNTTVATYPSNVEQKSKSKLNNDFSVLVPDEVFTKNIATGQQIAYIKSTYNVSPLGGKKFKMTLASQNTNDYLNNRTSSKSYTYDFWGNVLTETTIQGGLTQSTTMTYEQRGAWCVNKPVTVVAEQKLNNETYIRKTNFEYDSRGNLLKETKDPGDPNSVITEYKNYDEFGHTLRTEVTTNGQTRTASQQFSPSGLFPISKTDALGQSTTYEWDETLALLTSQSNRIGTTSYTYNNWGQLLETRSPDGLRSTKVLQWAPNGNSYGAKFYSYAQSSGSAPIYTWYNVLGQEVAQQTFGLDNKKISVFTEYDSKGRQYRVSEPSFESSAGTWAATYTYDDYNRVSTIATPAGNTSTAAPYGSNTVTISSPEGVKTTITNAQGMVESVSTNGKKVSYTYYASGLTKTATPEGGQPIAMEYDLQGKRTKLIDPDAGVVRSKYNGFGELLWEKQKIHLNADSIVTSNTYSPTGLLQNIVRNGETTTYSYDNLYRISSIEIAGKHKQSFSYDNFDRTIKVTEKIGTKEFEQHTEYDKFGRVAKETYPSGYYTQNSYDSNSNLVEVTDKTGSSIWKPLEENAKGQLLREARGGRVTTYGFDARSLPSSIVTPGVQSLAYSFDDKGNLETRIDNTNSSNWHEEQFSYDGMNRLTNWDIFYNGEVKQNSIGYSTQGNIETKTDLGPYTLDYGVNGKPHALASISGVPSSFPLSSLDVSYTDFKKIKTLTEGNKQYELTYGVDDQRRKSEYKLDGSTKLTRYYLGNYEEEVDATGNTRKIHYLAGGAIYILSSPPSGELEGALYYGYYDYQGSLLALVSPPSGDLGGFVERYAYDPWGARRNPTDWTQKDSRTSWLINRGYTGHEHLDAFGIINMNGRVYDPLTASFFSPDPYVQAPDNWLNYNRYSYCINNPMKYTDPSGEVFGIDDAIIIGAVIGAYMGGSTANGTFNPTKWDYSSGKTYFGMIGGAAIGGLTGATGFAIANSGMPLANTAAIATSSYSSSIGMRIVNGINGNPTPVSVSFGAAGYDFNSGEFGYFGKEGNSGLEDAGYVLGALGNLRDINNIINSTSANLYTQIKNPDGSFDKISHTGIKTVDGDVMMSYGPNDGKIGNGGIKDQVVSTKKILQDLGSYKKFGLAIRRSTSTYDIPVSLSLKSEQFTVNKYLFAGLRGISKFSLYQGASSNCVNWSSLGLWFNGIPNIGIHPFLLHGSIAIYNSGVYNIMASHLISNE